MEDLKEQLHRGSLSFIRKVNTAGNRVQYFFKNDEKPQKYGVFSTIFLLFQILKLSDGLVKNVI